MHELSLCMELIRVIEEQNRRQPFRRVRAVRLAVGALAGVEIEALRFGFTVAAQGTLAENAVLEIEQPAGQAVCLDCGAVVEVRNREDPCPRCGGYFPQVRGGTDLRVVELEVE
ncbi:MAG: hydrogenase maturation nickel metallochaperone HypA [Candidatus Contendobacter sp.]|nr:hydrogenase maturation nickel metallochaperone HypA [Candidatus Contendobacter sp.]MDG4559182.1 hydrogenase maturation nickel metallochaperone HypA [Candidatus Contendobacter sp.]